MLSVVIFFTGCFSILLPINANKDYDSVLRLLQRENGAGASEGTSLSGSDEGHIVKQLSKLDVLSLAQLASQLKKQNNRQTHNHGPHTHGRHQRHHHHLSRDDTTHYKTKDPILKHLLQVEGKPLKKSPHKRLSPNHLLNPIKPRDADERGPTVGLNEYSKIFVVLDPTTLQNSAANTEPLTTLLSWILSETSSAVDKTRQQSNKSHQYKGFRVKNSLGSRRYRRDSKEMYGGGGGSIEDDYNRPKRQRKEYGGGGGRTAIPYVKHRGDIYERDH